MFTNELKKELADQGLEGRWVSYKELVENQGFHQKEWVPYKRKKDATIDSSTFLNGTDPDGFIRRGDAILAVKTAEDAERHRLFLRERAQRQLGYNKEKGDELRRMARDSGLSTRIDDEYGDDDQDE